MANSSKCNKPKLLKDFLKDDYTNDVGSYTITPCKHVVQNQHLIAFKRSKSRATTSTLLAIHKASKKFIKNLQYFPFLSIKSTSILSRNMESSVKVKDILRWRSSRDLVIEESTPLDHCYSSPSRHTTITTSSTGSTLCSSPLTSTSSSWCDSDFSAEDFPSWCYASEDCYGENSTKKANTLLQKSPKTTMENLISMSYRTINDREMTESFADESIMEKRTMEETDEQYTPVSVLTSPFQEDRKIIANSYDSLMQDNLLMDLFWEELSTNKKGENDEFLERKLVATAEDLLRRVHEGCFEWTENKRENYVKEMEKGLNWKKHEEEKEEMDLELEKLVLNSLVDELLFDLISL